MTLDITLFMNADAILRKNLEEQLMVESAYARYRILFNSKFDHLYKVVDRVIAFTGRATGL